MDHLQSLMEATNSAGTRVVCCGMRMHLYSIILTIKTCHWSNQLLTWLSSYVLLVFS